MPSGHGSPRLKPQACQRVFAGGCICGRGWRVECAVGQAGACPCGQWCSCRGWVSWGGLPQPRSSTGVRRPGKTGTACEAWLSVLPAHGASSSHLLTEGGSPAGMQLGSITSSLRVPKNHTCHTLRHTAARLLSSPSTVSEMSTPVSCGEITHRDKGRTIQYGDR